MATGAGTEAPAAAEEERFGPIELGPESLLWRYSDRRMGFTGLGGGLIQLMHPGLGAGEDNLVLKAARSLAEASGCRSGARIALND